MDGSREWRRVEVCVPAEVELISAPEKQYSCQVININPDGLCVCGCDEIRSGQGVFMLSWIFRRSEKQKCILRLFGPDGSITAGIIARAVNSK